jgi:hypothetical protein
MFNSMQLTTIPNVNICRYVKLKLVNKFQKLSANEHRFVNVHYTYPITLMGVENGWISRWNEGTGPPDFAVG